MHREAKNKSLGERGKPGITIRKSDETRRYRIYIPKDNVGVGTQHVRNLETLTSEQKNNCVDCSLRKDTRHGGKR